MLQFALSLDGKVESTRIPAAFFAEMGFAAFRDLMAVRLGVTNAGETRRIWELLRRTDAAPATVTLVMNRDELLRVYPPGSKPTGSLASGLDELWRNLIDN